MKPFLFLLLMINLIGMSACNAATPQSSIAQTEVATTQYPGPAAEQAYPYPYPYAMEVPPVYPSPGMEEATPTYIPLPTPTADPSLGRVQGALFEAKSPVQVSLYLAEIKADEEGTEVSARFSPPDSPRVETNPDGSFTFVNITPGRYALILYTGFAAYLVNIPDKEDPILFTVEAGKTVDLGELNYDDLPLD